MNKVLFFFSLLLLLLLPTTIIIFIITVHGLRQVCQCRKFLFGIVPSAPITTGTTFALFIFHNSLMSTATSKYLLIFSSCLMSTLLSLGHTVLMLHEAILVLPVCLQTRCHGDCDPVSCQFV